MLVLPVELPREPSEVVLLQPASARQLAKQSIVGFVANCVMDLHPSLEPDSPEFARHRCTRNDTERVDITAGYWAGQDYPRLRIISNICQFERNASKPKFGNDERLALWLMGGA